MNTLWHDLRYAVRTLSQNKGFTAIALLTLALGIGATTVIFGVVNAVLLRPLPFTDPDRLMKIEDRHAGWWANTEFTYANFADIAKNTRTLEKLAAYRQWLFTLSQDAEPENVDGYLVSAEFFNVLGTPALLGRTFLPEEDRAGNGDVVVLSYGLWKRRFGSDTKILGKTTKVNGTPARIIGVMPADFRFPENAAMWMPLALADYLVRNRRAHLYTVIGRLKTGVSLEQARTETKTLAAAIDAENKGEDPDWTAYPAPVQERLTASVRLPILVLFCAVGCVLLIACANVANLLLARATGRTKEIGVRVALGASKTRIFRQLLTESLLLAAVGAAFGVLLSNYGLRAVVGMSPGDIPRLQDAAIDWRVFGFTLLVTASAGVLFGLAPSFQAFRVDLQNALRESRRASSGVARGKLRNILVVAEIAIALVLLAGAGLLTNSFIRLLRVPLGFNPAKVLTLQLFFPGGTESASDRRTTETLSSILESIREVPGIQSVGLTSSLPIGGGGPSTDFEIVGRPPVKPGDEPDADICVMDPRYLRTMQIPLIKGREFSERDSADAPRVMLINETMANRFWPGENPIGQRVTMKDWGPPLTGEIVGVVGDVKSRGLEQSVAPMIYWPYPQFPALFNYIVARTSGDPLSVVAGIKSQVRSVNPEQPVSEIRTMEQVLGESLAQRRFSLMLIGVFAGVSLLLAGVGVAGVMAFMVAQRTQEMGIRIALGAQRREVFGLVLGQGMGLTAFGLVIGLAGAFGLTRLLSSMLYGVTAGDPFTYAVVSCLLAGAALLACYIPARSATRVDPMTALRHE